MGKIKFTFFNNTKKRNRDGSIHFIDKMNGWVIRFYDSETAMLLNC